VPLQPQHRWRQRPPVTLSVVQAVSVWGGANRRPRRPLQGHRRHRRHPAPPGAAGSRCGLARRWLRPQMSPCPPGPSTACAGCHPARADSAAGRPRSGRSSAQPRLAGRSCRLDGRKYLAATRTHPANPTPRSSGIASMLRRRRYYHVPRHGCGVAQLETVAARREARQPRDVVGRVQIWCPWARG